MDDKEDSLEIESRKNRCSGRIKEVGTQKDYDTLKMTSYLYWQARRIVCGSVCISSPYGNLDQGQF